MAKLSPQEKIIYQELKDSGSAGITSWGMIEKYRITRLGAVIFNLKDKGLRIDQQRERRDGKNWARYRLVGGQLLPEYETRKQAEPLCKNCITKFARNTPHLGACSNCGKTGMVTV